MSDKTGIVPARTIAIEPREIDGVEMGVLDDGTPFLTSRGLARVCGVVPSAVLGWLPGWSNASNKPRDQKLRDLLAAQGYTSEALLERVDHAGGFVNAHPDSVCMAVLEYYAFEAGAGITEQALRSYRFLARRSLREFIYSSVGYDPGNVVPQRWKQFHDRMTLNKVPPGYFSVFKETADIVISAIQNGLVIDHHVVPDVSVGQCWAKHWKKENLAVRFGDRQKFPHKYPDYMPQAQANAFIEAAIYPLTALGEFRVWLQEVYLPEQYPRYIHSKVKAGALPPSRAELLLEAVNPVDEVQDLAPA